jgi:two-component system, NtrC family, sensor kinase
MNAASITRHPVKVVTDIARMPALPLDKHRTLLILMNLISNAKHAFDGMPDGEHEIVLHGELLHDRLRVRVADTGEGIPAENLTRMFAHGFTTRKDGHGFGLHSCIVAAKEMGGSLTAHSGGRGMGATFTLEIPVKALEHAR